MRSRTTSVFLTILLLAACGGDPEPVATDTMPEAITPPDVDAGMTLLVTVNDGHIATQESSIPVGPAVLTVANAGQQLHGLHVEGPGVKAALENPLEANESDTISVNFQNGEYVFYCPILDHRQNGETLTITVPTG